MPESIDPLVTFLISTFNRREVLLRTLEQLADGSFLVMPGIGEDDAKILRGQSKLFMGRCLRCCEPGE